MRQNKKLLALIVTSSLLVLFCSASLYAQTLGTQQKGSERPRQEILFSENGRFIFGQISDSSKDQFMLDTVTGRLWRIAETGEIGMFLRAIPYRDDEGKTSYVPENASD
jgi:hypothetical protein